MQDKENIVPQEITITLPPDVYVMKNPTVGIEFMEKDNPIPLACHPIDNDSIRILVWQIWRRRHAR